MAVNLTPQYLEAERNTKRPRRRGTPRLSQEMWRSFQAQASEKLQAELKTKLSDAKEAAEHERSTREESWRQSQDTETGSRADYLLGAPNTGKSRR